MASLLAGPKRWWLIATVAVGVIVGGGWFGLVAPQQASADEVRQQVEQADQRAAQASAQVRLLQKQNAELDSVKKELEALQAKIPTGEQVSALLVSVNKLAGASGVVLTTFKPGTVAALESSAPDKGTARLGYLPVTLTGTGNYDQIRAYLSKLEALDRALVVSSIGVARADTGSSSSSSSGPGTTKPGDLTMTLEARVFVRGDAVPAPANTAPKPSASEGKP